jgi:hypothetical protein
MRRAGRSLEGRIKNMYSYMQYRAKNNPTYKNRPVLISLERFRGLCIEKWNLEKLMQRWIDDNYFLGSCPSVDRIDNAGPYCEDNIQIIPMRENTRKRGLIDYAGIKIPRLRNELGQYV